MQFVVVLILMIIMDVTRPVPAPPRRPGLDEFQVTTAAQDRRIPVFWGDCWLRGPNLVWYGDLKIEKVKEKQKGMFTSKTFTVGYKYSLGFHLVFGYGNGDVILRKVVVGTDEVWSGDHVSGAFTIDKGGIWGGDKEGGGVSGTCSWLPGGQTQQQDSYLVKELGSRVPAWRSVASLVGRRVYIGTQTTLRMWYIKAQRLPAALGTGYHNINQQANPADIQYEILTNKQWGMGLNPIDIDVAEFVSNAKRLYDEDFGLSIIWDNAKSLEDILKEVDRHVDSVTFQDPLTGKWRMKLIRDDYDVGSLKSVNPSNATLISFARPTADELVNEVKVIYSSDEFDGEPVPLQVQDQAGYWNRENQKVSSELAYPGITMREKAAKVATRDMRALGYPFARLQLQLDRSFWDKVPTDRLRFDWPPLGITNMPIIIIEKELGTLKDGTMACVAVQDTFGVGEALYEEGDSSGWVPPDTSVSPPTINRMEFTPYWLQTLDDSISQPTSAVPMLMVEEPSSTHYGYDVQYTDPQIGSAFNEAQGTESFTPTALLSHDYLETAGLDTSATLIFGNLKGLDIIPQYALDDIRELGRSIIVIDNEWMALEQVGKLADGTWAALRVQRGLLDSAISRHLAGARVWFISEGLGRTPTQLYPFAAGTYKAKLITRARSGVLDISQAPILTLTTNGSSSNARPLYDYPPRALALNGSSTPSKLSGNSIAVTWKHANKVEEAKLKFHGDVESSRPGAVKYVVTLHNSLGTVIKASPDVFTNSYTFAVADIVGGLPESGYVRVVAVNSTGNSTPAVLWFGRSVDYANLQDAAPQRLLDEANPWIFLRMAD